MHIPQINTIQNQPVANPKPLEQNVQTEVINNNLTQPSKDCFIMKSGILPPKNWKPDKYAGLGPELSEEEKLKKKLENIRKPMYIDKPQTEQCSNEVCEEIKPKTFKDKIKDFGVKIKNYFKNLFSKNK